MAPPTLKGKETTTLMLFLKSNQSLLFFLAYKIFFESIQNPPKIFPKTFETLDQIYFQCKTLKDTQFFFKQSCFFSSQQVLTEFFVKKNFGRRFKIEKVKLLGFLFFHSGFFYLSDLDKLGLWQIAFSAAVENVKLTLTQKYFLPHPGIFKSTQSSPNISELDDPEIKIPEKVHWLFDVVLIK